MFYTRHSFLVALTIPLLVGIPIVLKLKIFYTHYIQYLHIILFGVDQRTVHTYLGTCILCTITWHEFVPSKLYITIICCSNIIVRYNLFFVLYRFFFSIARKNIITTVYFVFYKQFHASKYKFCLYLNIFFIIIITRHKLLLR